ncbi:PadR family transcriptional regulator [Salinibacterium sp. UTAS2018]|uniref:helix-turn-helix transcriptional regulator n=1 Tax=Salinibacterium sp. UTAS2018 TaxID=2508880 RepID=UPI0010095897|nr:helix-turn-helix transcriptional regulator [Salinibacterium sp. UTAS2018]QAV70046.1 PadR family transcriptional regulator [Salinibacterium sp. UTAS2018]
MKALGRSTSATADVLEVFLSSAEPIWGLKIVKLTQRPAGSVYPILERLENLGWTSSQWDSDADRAGPRRRLYSLSTAARAEAHAAVAEVRRRELRTAASRVATTA